MSAKAALYISPFEKGGRKGDLYKNAFFLSFQRKLESSACLKIIAFLYSKMKKHVYKQALDASFRWHDSKEVNAGFQLSLE